LEAEDSDGDTALHLVLMQMKDSRGGSVFPSLLRLLLDMQPKNIEQAPAINKVRHCLSAAHALQMNEYMHEFLLKCC